MIKREDFNGKKYEEMLAAMEADLVMYTEQVDGYNTIEECTSEEQRIMDLMKEHEAILNDIKYTLPNEVFYEGKRYSKKDVSTKILYFLNKIEVKWSYTLGLKQLYDLWKSEEFKEIPYRVYDTTLRTLDQITYKGHTEWDDILIVNEYLSGMHNEYSLDTGMLGYLSEMHNMLMNRMKEIDPTLNVPEQMPQ